jgi:hypothetical protein
MFASSASSIPPGQLPCDADEVALELHVQATQRDRTDGAVTVLVDEEQVQDRHEMGVRREGAEVPISLPDPGEAFSASGVALRGQSRVNARAVRLYLRVGAVPGRWSWWQRLSEGRRAAGTDRGRARRPRSASGAISA